MLLTNEQIRFLRLRSGQLWPPRTRKGPAVARLTGDLCGVQAQYGEAAALAVRARSRGLTLVDVERAIYEERSVVRTWCMRGTLHLVAAGDVGWMLHAVSPAVIAGSVRRFRQLGLDDATVARALKLIERTLADDGPLKRHELFAVLQAKRIDTRGQRGIHLLHRAGMLGMLCQGPKGLDSAGEDPANKGGPTYVLMRDWIGPEVRSQQFSKDEGLAELTRRYLAAHGPASPGDLAAWSGMSVKEADAAFKAVGSDLMEAGVAGHPAWILKRRSKWLREVTVNRTAHSEEQNGPALEQAVNMLPGFDNYLLGYRDRSFAVASEHSSQVNAGGGMMRPVMIVDGRVVATWKSTSGKGRQVLMVNLEPFEKLSRSIMEQVNVEVADLARFLGKDAGIVHRSATTT